MLLLPSMNLIKEKSTSLINMNNYTQQESVIKMTYAIKDIENAFKHESILDKFASSKEVEEFHDKVNVYKNTVMFWYKQNNPQRASKEVDCMVKFIENCVK